MGRAQATGHVDPTRPGRQRNHLPTLKRGQHCAYDVCATRAPTTSNLRGGGGREGKVKGSKGKAVANCNCSSLESQHHDQVDVDANVDVELLPSVLFKLICIYLLL